MAGETIAVSAVVRRLPGRQVYAMAAIYLVVGLVVGYLVRGGQSPALSAPGSSPHVVATAAPAPVHPGAKNAGHVPTAQQMKQMADKQAAPLMEKLKSNPKDSASLMQVGAIYYTTGQYTEASAYYERALQTEPANVADRVKLATSLYREGDADAAIAQLNKALTYDPKDANTLFDLGMIKLQGKQDGKGALAAWRQLLKSNPQMSTDHKAQVQRLIAGVATSSNDQHGSEGAPGK
jgi:cytochrome c-type biogenesis protein CcmH/NrfG